MKSDATGVLGYSGTAEYVALLEPVRDEERDVMVREHAGWALTRFAARDTPHGD